jgi:hypothetical protein
MNSLNFLSELARETICLISVSTAAKADFFAEAVYNAEAYRAAVPNNFSGGCGSLIKKGIISYRQFMRSRRKVK